MTAQSGIAADGSRLFTRFFDPVDMIASFASDATMAEVNQSAAEHGLRFPLVLDPAATIREHMAAAEFAPASARFGAYVDNLPGMNWELPGGKRVRIGERVVKSTTGYDLFRFLLHADGRYGHATDYVLRLRPESGDHFGGRFSGQPDALGAVRRRLVSSSWNHWIDAVDWVAAPGGEARIEVGADALPGEREHFLRFFRAVAGAAGCSFEERPEPSPAGIPMFSVKTLPGRVPEIAAHCAEALGCEARGLALNGAVLVAPDRQPGEEFLEDLRRRVEPDGGHLSGSGIPPRPPSAAESAWADRLEADWRAL